MGDWLLRRTSVLPFWRSPSYTPPKKNSLKGWSRSGRSGNWWSCSFEKISTSEITGCHLGNLVSLSDHCDFILHLQGLNNEPSYQWDPMWALSISCFAISLILQHWMRLPFLNNTKEYEAFFSKGQALLLRNFLEPHFFKRLHEV